MTRRRQALTYLQNINHNPLDTGDNLQHPGRAASQYLQTWWGFPTWRETLSPFWVDPTVQVNMIPGQPASLIARLTRRGQQTLPSRSRPVPARDDGCDGGQLPGDPAAIQRWLRIDHTASSRSAAPAALWSQYSWEDDLVMTGVRSFDIKAYDNSLAGYADLGWGDDPRVTGLLESAESGRARGPATTPTWRGTTIP